MCQICGKQEAALVLARNNNAPDWDACGMLQASLVTNYTPHKLTGRPSWIFSDPCVIMFLEFKTERIILFRMVKGKAIPLQAWTGPEGSRRLRLPDFKAIGAGMW